MAVILPLHVVDTLHLTWSRFGLVAAASLLWLADPPIRSAIAEEDATDAVLPRLAWLTPRFLVACFAALAAVLVLSGSDVSFVAAAKHFSQPENLGLVLAASGLGSVIGGLTYGVSPKAPPLFFLLFALAAATVPIGLASSMLPRRSVLYWPACSAHPR